MNINKQTPQTGFTLIELLVVIAIIGLLSSVVLASLSGARKRAQVTALVENFRQIETAFTAWALDENRVEWFEESDYGTEEQTDYSNLEYLVNNTRLGEYLSAAASSNFDRGLSYSRRTPVEGSWDCGAGVRNGAGVTTWGINSDKTAQQIDDIVDDGDGSNCGRVQWAPDQNPQDIDLYYKFPPL